MSSMRIDDPNSNLLFVGFNQDSSCFACGTKNGFRIFNVDPFKPTFNRVFTPGSIGIVEMLYRCNLLVLVGGGANPHYPPNKVMIWDDSLRRVIGDLTFRSEVLAAKLRRDRVVVVLREKTYVYRFNDLKLLDQINTRPNDKGLVALCPDSSKTVLACPGISKGHVRVELYDIRKASFISAHESELACLALTMDGSRLATASVKGTLVRVHDTHTGAMLHELRRGIEETEIYSIAFNNTATFLATSSARDTVHIFSLQGSEGGAGGGAEAADEGAAEAEAAQATDSAGNPGNPRSNLAFLSNLLPSATKYFASEWSFAQVRNLARGPTICAFTSDPDSPNSLVVLSADGAYSYSTFDPREGGEAVTKNVANFLSEDNEDAMNLLPNTAPEDAGGAMAGALPVPQQAAPPMAPAADTGLM
uniref:Autophagy-related protein 18 n=1 Tax=Phaeomonas parva TaxID=124430 RepID=A0A7S1TY51_9STRA|mmetsp:Transcript_20801/g.63287  ORF Transcript_20801/g.63287 Transcript_20801/m.63287 type:complete len:419 (+) Transcript_20801:84-1340(+)|eukprot:CAMPEP_0118884852 /NCGR_PEP_ID=MMETSP1163-20130328/23565_1 /TAXON_ID=124430 /ORGANISM="Phaeomonas parva, Strain CCMP2877" /LENGTH=418 /DNA_ID=CAMNT_0006822757 /DNA_START=65 /DNA_END=1321 /DNA_ORIENTATION=-